MAIYVSCLLTYIVRISAVCLHFNLKFSCLLTFQFELQLFVYISICMVQLLVYISILRCSCLFTFQLKSQLIVYIFVSLIVQLPFTLNGESSRVPFQHWKLTFLKVFPLMFLIISPRLLALSHFFAYCSNPDGILALLLSIIFHGLCYCIYLIYKNKSINEKLEEFLFLGFVSSMIAPCTIIDPRHSV